MNLIKKIKRAVCLAGAGILMCSGFFGCGKKGLPLDAEHGIADQSNLFGMCYLLEERSAESLDIQTEVQLMKNLGVKTVRQWMHFTHFMSSPTELKENNQTTENMHKLLAECEEAGMEFEQLVETVESYIDGQNTYFVLENLETLRKNGRLSNLKAFVASALKIKPVMKATPEGTIVQLDQARGINKALVKLVNYLAEDVENPEEKVLALSHCNCPDRAKMVRDAILERIPVKDVILLDSAGITTMYANDGGVVVVI